MVGIVSTFAVTSFCNFLCSVQAKSRLTLKKLLSEVVTNVYTPGFGRFSTYNHMRHTKPVYCDNSG